MERRRRERINRSLESLKTLLLQPQVKDTKHKSAARPPRIQELSRGAVKLLSVCLRHRKRLSAEWRKLRSWSTQFSSYRALLQDTRPELEVEVVEARRTPSKKASPPACRELLASWDVGGKASGSDKL